MKKLYYMLLTLFVIIPIGVFAQTYPLRVIITTKQNFTPNIGEFKENPSKYIGVRVLRTSSNANPQNVYFELSINRVSPPFDVSLRSNKYIRPNNGITIKSMNTDITQAQMYDNFVTHTVDDFIIQGLELDASSDFTKITDNLKLPEGFYKVCLNAYDFDTPPGEEPKLLSDPNSSCTVVRVCYKAESPKWLEPVNCINDLDCYDKEITPARMLRFSWTPARNSCGVDLGHVDYAVKLFKVFEGQTPDEAVNINPPLYMWEDINSTNLTVDTFSVQNIFVIGEKYAVQVYVNPVSTQRLIGLFEIENGFKSKAVSFIYGKSDLAENEDEADNEDDTESEEEEENKNKFEQEVNKDVQLIVNAVDCGIALPANQNSIETLAPRDEVMIDKFPLIITQVERIDSTQLYKGTGIIRKPIIGEFEYFNWVNVMVEFDSLAVNTDKQVIGGFARAVYNKELNTDFKEFFSSFDSWPNWAQKYCGIGTNKGIEQVNKYAKNYVEKFQGETSMVLQMFNLSYQTLPIKIRYNISGYDFDVAISDMKFSPKGSAFSMLYFMKIPEMDQVLPFGIRNVCMNGNPVQNGEFCLLADVEIPIGSENKKLVLRGGEASDGNKAKTYVKWGKNGFEGIRLDAALRFYKGSGISNIDESKQSIDVSITSDFISWDDWIADISMDEFKIDGVSDFSFKVENAVYDHSTKRNHESYSDAVKNLSKYDGTIVDNSDFTGVFFKELSCNAKIFASDDPVKFSINNTIFDSEGVSFSCEATKLLNLETGNAGGWQFSIDTMKMVLVRNIFREGSMSGQMKVPLNENESAMQYSSVISYPKGGKLQYKLNVVPTISYNFLKYFTAEISNTSSIELTADGDGVIVTALFNGKVSTRNCKLKLDLVTFNNMMISNFDPVTKEKTFVFNLGDWGFGAYDQAKSFISGKSTGGGKGKKSNSSKPLYKIDVGPFQGIIQRINFGTSNVDASNRTGLSKGLEKAKSKGNLKGKTLTIQIPVDINIGFGDNKMAGGGVTNDFSFDVLYDNSFNASPKLDKFHYKISEIRVKGNFGVVDLTGTIGFYDEDPTYGDGAGGSVECTFPMGLKAKADVMFGKKMRSNGQGKAGYFCVNGSVKLGSVAAIPVADPLVINGFGAGVWKNMTMSNTDTNETGFSFVPSVEDQNLWGFRGQVFLSLRDQIGGKNTLAGSAEISGEIRNGALEKICFNGKVSALGTFSDSYMSKIKNSMRNLSKAMEDNNIRNNYCVNGEFSLKYIHSLKQFSMKASCRATLLWAEANAYLELFADGKNKKWYVAIGKPMYENKDSVICVSSSFDFKVVKCEQKIMGYMIAGNKLEYDMPPIPEKILRLVKEKPSRTWPKNAQAGFMLGCRFSFDFEFNFGPLFAHLETMVGFDMSFKNEKGRSCSDGRKIKGMKGYYLRGQLYAYFSGGIGVQLKFFGKKRRWNLCKLTCGGYLKGGLPSPTYLKGAVGVRGEILGGLIKFNTNAKFTIGSECHPPEGDPLKDFVLIEDVTPGFSSRQEAQNQSSSQRPSIFVSPKARFSVLMNKPFELYTENDTKRFYVFRHYSTTLTNVYTNSKVSLTNETRNSMNNKNNLHREFNYKFTDKLEPNTIYRLEIACRVQEINKKNNKEHNPIDENGKYYSLEQSIVRKSIYFKTGAMPNRIVEDNIRDAYPHNRQFETFVKDGEKGYIVLQYSQAELIKNKLASLGKKALFGYFKNRTNKYKPDILFYYDYSNRNVGGTMRDVIVFDMKNLDKNSIYEIRFFVAEKFDKNANYRLLQKQENLSADNYFDDDKESGDENVISYTAFVDVDKFSEDMKIGGNYAGATSNSRKNSNSSNQYWNTPSDYEAYLNGLNYNAGNNDIKKEYNYSSRYNSSSKFSDRSKVDKLKTDKTKNAEKAVIRDIFKYYFRTSSYESIDSKLNNITGRMGTQLKVTKQMRWTSYVRKNGNQINFHYPMPFYTIYFPYYTTKEEVFGGKAFEESSNAVYQQSNFSLRTDNDDDRWIVGDAWKIICFPFLERLKPFCNSFSLPHTHYSNFHEKTFENNTNTFNWFLTKYSDRISSFEGRLTTDEINSGIVYRSKLKRITSWAYIHYELYYLHLLYASNLADEINRRKGQLAINNLINSRHFLNISDTENDKNYLSVNFNCLFHFVQRELYLASDKLFDKEPTNIIKFIGPWVNPRGGKTYDKFIRYLQGTEPYHYKFGGYSNLFILNYIWNKSYDQKRGNDFYSNSSIMRYPIGKHTLWMDYTKPIRLGSRTGKKLKLGQYDIP